MDSSRNVRETAQDAPRSRVRRDAPSLDPAIGTRAANIAAPKDHRQREPREELDGYGGAIARSAQKFDISAFPYVAPPGVLDAASGFFQLEQKGDFTALPQRADHRDRPLWISGWGKLILDNSHPLAPRVQDFLVTVAEPMSRPQFLHEYRLTTHSLYAAVSVGLNPRDIVSTLDRFSKNGMPPNVAEYITHCGQSYGKVKLVLRSNKYFVETTDQRVLQFLVRDPKISQWRAHALEAEQVGRRASRPERTAEEMLTELSDDDDESDDDCTYSFQIQDDKVGEVAHRCLALHYPALEEYDFRNDEANADLAIDLRPGTQIRPYQEKCLSKMFGNGRAKSGIIVLPCGAGKTLVGVTAACTIKKGVVVLATSNMSAIQWKNEFIKWSSISPSSVAIFSSESKSAFAGASGVVITTYSMVTSTQERAHESAKMIEFLRSREWGLLILDEVHVAPARMFRGVISVIKAHSKLGLTATLLREDDKIGDLNFLIGPKLYEANWMELSQQGHIATVQCAEVWCPMPPGFYEQYLKAKPGARTRPLLCAMNPSKFQACQYLIRYHESRGDKIIVFSDNLYALEVYAKKLQKPYLYGGTSSSERQEILDYFRNSPKCSTLFLSKIGDTSLDLPEATCLIQLSAQYGSRRQEAQRLGRVLRAKRRAEEGFNAFFYSLVSKDTVEMVHSSKRQVFLVDQGYAFRVITQLKNIEDLPGLAFGTARSRSELLDTILADMHGDTRKEEERETAGLLADGSLFHRPGDEPLRDARGGLGAAAGAKGANKISKKRKHEPRNKFFKSIAREKERRKKAALE